LVDREQSKGEYQVRWHADSFVSGIYFYQLQVDGRTAGTRKLLLIK